MYKGSHRFQKSRHAWHTKPVVDEQQVRRDAMRERLFQLYRPARWRASQLTVGSVVPGRVRAIRGAGMVVDLGSHLLGVGRSDPRLSVGQSIMVKILHKEASPL